jgi:hypothetical protein
MASEPQTTGPRKPQVVVEIEGREVRLIVMCSNHYDAIKMYEDLVGACRQGSFTFSMDVTSNAPT